MVTAWQYLDDPWRGWYASRGRLDAYYPSRGDFFAEVQRLCRALAGHDVDTGTHSARVWRHAMAVADELGLDPVEREQLGLAAKLHDVGKLCIPAALLTKSEPLADDELAWLQDHPVVGQRMVQAITPCPAVSDAVRWHHERHDGTGYPDGLRGDRIPLFARVLAVCEAFAAMTDARPYTPPLWVDDAVEVLRRESGRQFHPDAAESLVASLPRTGVAHGVLGTSLTKR